MWHLEIDFTPDSQPYLAPPGLHDQTVAGFADDDRLRLLMDQFERNVDDYRITLTK